MFKKILEFLGKKPHVCEPFSEEEKQAFLIEQEKILRTEMEGNVANFINLPSLFVEPKEDGFLIKWLPAIISGITLVTVFFKK